jgi:hypothetical protein
MFITLDHNGSAANDAHRSRSRLSTGVRNLKLSGLNLPCGETSLRGNPRRSALIPARDGCCIAASAHQNQQLNGTMGKLGKMNSLRVINAAA